MSERPHQITGFNKGLNKDVHISLLEPEFLREAYNFRLYTEDGNAFITANLKGTELISSLTADFVPIGYVVAREFCYIFSHNPLTGEGEIGMFPSLDISNVALIGTAGVEINNLPISYTYKPLYNFYYPPSTNRTALRHTNFNFSLEYPVEAEARLDYDGSYNLYFVDFNNKIRVINTGIARQENGLYKLTERMYEPNNFFDTMLLILTSDEVAKIDYLYQEDIGRLRCATYIYHIAYSNDKINKTAIISSSMPVVVYERRNNSIDMGSEDSRYGNTEIAFSTSDNYEETFAQITNVMQVSGVDTQFRYMHVFFEIIYGIGNKEYGVYEFQEPIDITGNTISFKHTGLEPLNSLSDKAINIFYAQIATAKSVAQLDSRLLLFHTKTDNAEKQFKALENYAQRIQVRHIKVDLGKLSDFEYSWQNAYIEQTLPQLNLSNSGYQNPYHIYYNLGYHYGEIYQFGIQYILKGNVFSNVFLLSGADDLNCITSFSSLTNDKGIYRFPKRGVNGFDGSSFTSNLHTDHLVAMFPTFSFPDWNLTLPNPDENEANEFVRDNVIGFRLVRLERKKDCFGQGIVVPCYSVPPFKWGFDSQPLRELTAFYNYHYGYRTRYPGSDLYYFVSNSTYRQRLSDFLRDSKNVRKVIPLPSGLLDGADRLEGTIEFNNFQSIIISQAYRDPFRVAYVSMDIIADERLYGSVLNNNDISFEVTGSYLLKPTYQFVTLTDFYGTANNACASYCMQMAFFNEAYPPIFPHLAGNENDSYARINNYLFKGKSYFVYAGRPASNEKFTSQINTHDEGGFKIFHPNNQSGGENGWVVPMQTNWNAYVGITLGYGWETHTAPLSRTGALEVNGVPTNLYFRDTALEELYTPPSLNMISPQPGDTSNPMDCYYLSIGTSGGYYYDPEKKYMNYDVNYLDILIHDRAWIVDLFTSSTGRTTNIYNWYDGLTQVKFFIPITLNLSKQEVASNSYFIRGYNGDNYQGVWYRKFWFSNYRHSFGGSNGDRYVYGGVITMAKCDNNYNPYSRVRELWSVTEREPMSEGTQGNRRAFFPVYANSLMYNQASPPRIKPSDGVYFSATKLNVFFYAKNYHTFESLFYELGGNSQWGGYIVNLLNVKDILEIQNYFPTRLYYSEKHINNSFIDNYRVVYPFSFQDYDLSLGKGTAVRVLNNRLYIIQEDGVSLVSFNERQAISEEGSVYIDTTSVLSPYQATLSRKYGSIHRDSVIATDNSIYFIDAKRRSICRIEEGGVRDLSEGRISSFLNEIFDVYGEDTRELSGAIYVRSFYNRRYDEINFVIYKRRNPAVAYNIVFSEKLNVFIVHSYLPAIGFSIFDDYYTLFDNEPIITFPNDSPVYQNGLYNIYQNDVSNIRNRFYGTDYPMYFHYIVNTDYQMQKIFDNITILSNHILPTRLFYRITNENGIVLQDTIYYANGIPLGVINNIVNRISYREHTARFAIPYTDKSSNIVGRRYRDKAIEIGIYYDTNDYVEIQRIITYFRYSFS